MQSMLYQPHAQTSHKYMLTNHKYFVVASKLQFAVFFFFHHANIRKIFPTTENSTIFEWKISVYVYCVMAC